MHPHAPTLQCATVVDGGLLLHKLEQWGPFHERAW